MRARSSAGFLALVFSGLPLAASGHHSVEAAFDTSEPIALDGVVQRIVWANPHAYLFLAVTDEDGSAETWAVELSPPHALTRAGFTRDVVAAGDAVTITAFPQRPDAPAGAHVSGFESAELADSLAAVLDQAIASRLVHAASIVLPDGQVFESDDTMRRKLDTPE